MRGRHYIADDHKKRKTYRQRTVMLLLLAYLETRRSTNRGLNAVLSHRTQEARPAIRLRRNTRVRHTGHS
jgi:hypothetical protein